MAIRLPVVLAQHSRRVSSFTDCEESWITSLLFEERLDATLVADLASIQLDSTDYLCLAGLKGDFVLVTWESTSVILREMVRLGFDSFDIVPVDGSAKVSSPNRSQSIKKIYLMGFNKAVPVSEPIGQLKRLLESKSTPVFQLQITNKPSSPSASKALPVISDAGLTSSKPLSGSSNYSSSGMIGALATNVTHTPSNAVPQIGSIPLTQDRIANGIPDSGDIAYEDDDFPHIDNLVDELDRFDS